MTRAQRIAVRRFARRRFKFVMWIPSTGEPLPIETQPGQILVAREPERPIFLRRTNHKLTFTREQLSEYDTMCRALGLRPIAMVKGIR